MDIVIYILFGILGLLMLFFVAFVLCKHKINSEQVKNVPRDEDDFDTILINNRELLSSCYCNNQREEQATIEQNQERK